MNDKLINELLVKWRGTDWGLAVTIVRRMDSQKFLSLLEAMGIPVDEILYDGVDQPISLREYLEAQK